MCNELDTVMAEQGGVASTAQLQHYLGRAAFETAVARGDLAPVWTGVYSRTEPDTMIRLAGLDLRAGEPVAVCLHTAAVTHGFATEDDSDLHVLTPLGHQLRGSDGLVVHRRAGAPLSLVDGRPVTEPAWTAVEVARGLRRPRALATLDAALRSRTCDRSQLRTAAARQAGRPGIVVVRDLIPLAVLEAESAMESEARLAMLDGGLPPPVLQYEIVDRNRQTWRVDFAWPDRMLAVEYQGYDWHSSPDALRRDNQKRAALGEVGWTVLAIVGDDVRRHPVDMLWRIKVELARPRAA